jgi:putative addiction module killer protein
MVAIFKSATFDRWLRKLPDYRAKARIEMRIRRLSLGNHGDVSAKQEGLPLSGRTEK